MGILNHNTLVIDQVTNFMSNDFAVADTDGNEIGRIQTEGSALGRMFMGSRKLTVLDGDGTPLLRLEDKKTLGRERMEIFDGNGQPLAQLVKRITFFKTRFSIELDGAELNLTGNMWGFDFSMTGPHGTMATVSRDWAGLGKALLGHSRYAVELSPDLPPRQRQAVLGAVIALDLVREKEQNNS